MKFKKNWKRFWTLNRHHAEGFTLVELIVVIAILAILGGIAVPAYSGYVEKANKTADIALASEVAHALTLYSYSNPGTAGGYVTITKDGTTASTPEMEAAMTAVFGEGWQNNDALALKADWAEASGSSMLNYAINNADTAQIVADSTFLNEASTDGMLDALTTLTGIVNNVITKYDNNGGDVEGKLKTLLGEEFVTTLNNTGLSSGDAYNTAVSNMMVGYFANALNSSGETDDPLVNMVFTYTTLYAYAESTGNDTLIDNINENLNGISKTNDLNPDTLIGMLDEDALIGYGQYMNEKASIDVPASQEIMGALAEISNSYTDAESLSNPDLYNSESVKMQADDYVNAIKTVAGMGQTELDALKTSVGSGSVVVALVDGVVTVSPVLS